MITRTQISVDDATQEVMDKLSDALVRKPEWADQFTRNLPHEVKEVMDESLVSLEQRLDKIITSTDVLKVLQSDQASGLVTLQSASQTQAERFDQFFDRVESDVARPVEQAVASLAVGQAESVHAVKTELNSVITPIKALLSEINQNAQRHADALAVSQTEQVKVQHQSLELLHALQVGQAEGSGAMQTFLASALTESAALRASFHDAAQQQAEASAVGQILLTSEQKNILNMLRLLQADMAQHRQELIQISRRIDTLSRPWWKKLLGISREKKT